MKIIAKNVSHIFRVGPHNYFACLPSHFLLPHTDINRPSGNNSTRRMHQVRAHLVQLDGKSVHQGWRSGERGAEAEPALESMAQYVFLPEVKVNSYFEELLLST
jgi:hypothetical protein